MGEIGRDEAQAIASCFQADRNNGFYVQLAVESIHYDRAQDWLRRFDTPLRTLDALHLAIVASHHIPLLIAGVRLVAD